MIRSFSPSSRIVVIAIIYLVALSQNTLTGCFVIKPTISSALSSTRLHYWFCDPNNNNCNNNGGNNHNNHNNNDQRNRRHYDPSEELEVLEEARQSFEAIIQEHNVIDGIQEDGIVLHPTATTSISDSIYRHHQRSDSFDGQYKNHNDYGSLPPNPSQHITSSNSRSSFSFPSESISSSMTESTRSNDVHHNSYNEKHDPSTDMLLTTSGRLLRELEMKLLRSLIDSEDATEALIHFWTTERDSYAANDLLMMSSVSSKCSENLVNEEIMLTTMTETYPTWAEPFSRLAWLHYYKGNYQKAEAMALHALQLKPWHFEAISILVSINETLMNHQAVRYYQTLMLPPYSERSYRKVWVEQAIDMAQKQLRHVEKLTEEYKRRQREQQQQINQQQQQQSVYGNNHNNYYKSNENQYVNNNIKNLSPDQTWQ